MIPHPDELHPYLLSNWMELIQGFTKKCLIVANLPYNIYITYLELVKYLQLLGASLAEGASPDSSNGGIVESTTTCECGGQGTSVEDQWRSLNVSHWFINRCICIYLNIHYLNP